MILIVNVCKEKLHYWEFVKPIEDILRNEGVKFETVHYRELDKKRIDCADKIIICGTSLKDNQFAEDIGKFGWIRETRKPILGICAGMQIIGRVFGGKIKKKTEIGFYFEKFEREFLGIGGEQEVYHLHNYYSEFSDEFETFARGNGIAQAVRHKEREIYGILFHPEVRQRGMVIKFCNS